MGADNRAFAAALVDMGVRGHVRLVEEDGGWLSRKQDAARAARRLRRRLPARRKPRSTRSAATGESIMMEQKNHAKFSVREEQLGERF